MVGCQPATPPDPPTPPAQEKEITDGLFLYSFGNEGSSYNFYIHFHKNGVFYFSGLNGNQKLVGYYEVKDEQWSSKNFKNREDASAKDPKPYSEATAPQTIHFFSLSGSEIGISGYDKELGNIYSANIQGQPSYCSELLFVQDTEAVANATLGVENGVAIFKYEVDGDTSSYVDINHDGSYTDMIITQVSGTWTLENGVYTLTPEDKTDTPATLTLSADQKSATYKPDGGDAVELKLYEEALVLEDTFVGSVKIPAGGGVEIDGTYYIYLYTNGTCVGSLMMGDRELAKVEGGKWSKDDAGVLQTLALGGDTYSAPSPNVEITPKTIQDGKFRYIGTFKANGNEMQLTIDMEIVVAELMKAEDTKGKDSITFYPDFTFKATGYSGAAAMEGTWSMPGYTLNLTMTGQAAGVMTPSVSMDPTTHDLTVTISRGESAVASYVLKAADWGSKLQGKAPGPVAILSASDANGKDSITFYDDFTFAATGYSGQAKMEGTWAMPGYSLQLELTGQAAGAMTIAAEMDSTSHDFTVTISRGGSAVVSFVLKAADWGSILQGKAPQN
ncbi:MAG: hypothetical protein KBS59_07060 [Clostridiales bacterium]|nr:hypothetical protein [Clostridiales bacterium]